MNYFSGPLYLVFKCVANISKVDYIYTSYLVYSQIWLKIFRRMILSFCASFYEWSPLWLRKRNSKINTGEDILHFMERVVSSKNFWSSSYLVMGLSQPLILQPSCLVSFFGLFKLANRPQWLDWNRVFCNVTLSSPCLWASFQPPPPIPLWMWSTK
jgi:hypothetical protein